MILVTGGTGLVGSHLLYNLIKDDQKVRAIYRTKDKLVLVKKVFSYYSEDFETLFSKIEWLKGDITDVPLLSKAFKDITYVYHCAALISFDPKDYHQLRQINIDGTANIVNLSISYKVKKLCYVSSIAAVGQTENNEAITEDTEWNKEENHSVYAITKYGAEMEVWRGTQEGLEAVIVNPGIIIGPGHWRSGSGSLFKRIYKGLSHYTTGSTGYVDVNDVTKIMQGLMQSTIKNERFIVVAENITYQTFFNITAKYLNVKPPEKEASTIQLQIAWRLDWLNSKLRGKRRRLVRQTVTSLQSQSQFDNSKVVKALNYQFMALDVSIEQTSQLFSS